MELSISESPAEALKRLLDLLQHHCLLGQLHFRTWQRLNESFRDDPDVGNNAPLFFLYTADAHLNSALLILNRLIDKRRDALSLRRFLQRAKTDARHFSHSTPGAVREAVEKDVILLDGLEDTSERIRQHRNSQFVHLSERLIQPPFGVVPDSEGFAYADIGAILLTAGSMLNRYSLFLSGNEIWMQVAGEDSEFPYLAKLLHRGYKGLDDDQMAGH